MPAKMQQSSVLLLLFCFMQGATSFLVASPASLSTTTLTTLRSADNDEESMSESERMAAVRSLQKSFYASTAEEEPRAALDPTTGMVSNLPLWRVGWVEVPGRTNCLNVHEGQYTHMFETILNGPRPWYFGHLHLPGGFKMTRTGESRFLLKSWRQELQDEDRYDQMFGRSAVVGCLMQITDYRRLEDGRLCLFVQALERFVVDKVIQEFPYSVATVQMLPDQEELPEGLVDENFCKLARGTAVQSAFQYHPYEFCNVKLPINQQQEFVSSKSINAAALGKLLPFASYSLDESLLDDVTETKPASFLEGEGFSGGEPPLEKQLEAGRLLRNPPSLSKERKNVDLDGLETLLWLAVEEMIQKTGFVMPAELLALQPPHMDYLDLASPTIDFVHVEDTPTTLSSRYPAYRRQKRLSYSLPAILEDTRVGSGMRQAFLGTPSTKARLQAVLERVESINASLEEFKKE